MANNNYPQITSVTSESLQAQIRNLLPSQEGFGTDLMAQNVIVPIIDLTSAAEGSSVPQNLQTALAFGSQTAFRAISSTVAVANTPGFYRVTGTAAGSRAASNYKLSLDMTDGFANKIVWSIESSSFSGATSVNANIDLTFYLDVGITLNAVSGAGEGIIIGSVRQIADVNGTLINPSGFNPQ